jgi:lysozyme family protein
MQNNYQACLTKVLQSEGGYTNDAADPGGPTNYGITIIDYRKYLNPNGTATDVKNMKLSDAEAIYKSKYWDAMSCDQLPSGVDYTVFDYGVNSGISRSAKILQQFVGVTVDGQIGPDTIAATNDTDAVELINAICDERLAFLQSLHTWSTFGKGWSARVAGVRAASIQMAGTVPVTPVAQTSQSTGILSEIEQLIENRYNS